MPFSDFVEVKPIPTKQNALDRIKSLKIPISEIVDVGVRECTSELIHAFPNVFHHLFEPASQFYADIANNYGPINYKLYEMALSDANSDKFLTVTSLERNGVPTHSSIRDEQSSVDGVSVISSSGLSVRRFDTLPNVFKDNYLLKVDVDGQDLQVIKGFGAKLKKASVVIVEVTYSSFFDRLNYLNEADFRLFDLVDFVYYGPALYQFDAVFLRNDLVTDRVRPSIVQFERQMWQPFNPK